VAFDRGRNAPYFHYLSAVGEEVAPQQLKPVIRDPKDQAIVETAVAGEASVICTQDSHFYEPPALAFCAAHGIRVMNDLELLRMLRSTGP
jgi:hypothetical protein